MPVTPPSPATPSSPLRVWVLACRPATLTAAVAPVAVGTAIAYHVTQALEDVAGATGTTSEFARAAVKPLPALATFVGAMLLQIGSNFANDVYDFEKGADNHERLGPARAVQSGWLSARQMKRAMWVVFALALLVGIYLASIAGWPIVVIGICSIVAAIAYTGGPYPLGYNGLGDLFVLVFFGFVAVLGTVYVHLLAVPWWAWIPAFGVGAAATNILVVNNLRDRVTDRAAGKRTMAVRFGRRAAEIEYLALYGVTFMVPLALVTSGSSGPMVFSCWVAAPLAWRNYQHLKSKEGHLLNETLVRTAKLVFVYALSLALGLTADTLEGW